MQKSCPGYGNPRQLFAKLFRGPGSFPAAGKIGGLKEKTLAAFRAGITILVIPKENVKDLEEIPPHVLSRFRVVTAEMIEDVLATALERMPAPKADEQK